MGKILGLIFKLAIIGIIVFVIYCATIGKDFGKKQWNKVVGMYYVYKGDEAFQAHNMQDAINAYRQGLILFPNHYEAWLNLGNIYVVYEDYYSATQAYENAIRAKNNYTVARMNLGIVTAEKIGDFDSAINQYQSIISAKKKFIRIPFIYDDSKSTIMNKGIAYYNMGRAYSQKALYTPKERSLEKKEYLGKAATAYENAILIVKNKYDMLYNLALTYHLLGDYRKAGMYYCEAIYAEPMNYEAHYNLGLLLKHINQDAYSIDELEKAAVLSTGNFSRHSKYIFDILSSVSMQAIQKGKIKSPEEAKKQAEIEKANKKTKKKFFQKEKDKPEEETTITVEHAKPTTDSSEAEILENFRKCNSKFLFEMN